MASSKFKIQIKERGEDKSPRRYFVTPPGTGIFPKLVNWGQFKEKGTGKLGKKEYTVEIDFPEEDAAEFIELIEAAGREAYDEAMTKAKEAQKKSGKRGDIVIARHLPIRDALDANKQKVDGYVRLKFKLAAERETTVEGVKKIETQRPVLYTFDEKRKTVTYNGLEPYSGATLQVSGEIQPWVSPVGAGVNLRMKSVFIMDNGRNNAARDANDFADARGGDDSDYALASDDMPQSEGDTTPEPEGDIGF